MTDVISPEHAAAATRFRQLWSLYEDNRDLMLMGAYAPGRDAQLDEAVARHDDMLAFLRQDQGARTNFASSCKALIESFLP